MSIITFQKTTDARTDHCLKASFTSFQEILICFSKLLKVCTRCVVQKVSAMKNVIFLQLRLQSLKISLQLSQANNCNTYQLMHLSSVLFSIIDLALQMQNFIFKLRHHLISVESNRISLSQLELFSNTHYIRFFLRQ